MSKTVFFSVGEPSGDQHAGRLITQIGRRDPKLRMRGFGGQAMRDAGCQIDVDLTQHAVVGLLEVLPKLRQFFRFADRAESLFKQGSVDAVVLVDFPGFNWHIAKRAKKYDIPVYYYCPPQLWAWGGWRVRKMRRNVDHVLAVLPIEDRYFRTQGIPTTYVGHPFFDSVAETKLDQATMQRFRWLSQQGQNLVAVLPGSRGHEVHRTWPLMLESVRRLHRKHPDSRFLVAAYRDDQCRWCRQQLDAADASLPIEFFVGRTSEIIEASVGAMMVSGSVSLELMARRTPAAVVYRVGRLVHAVGRLVLRVNSITLPNLMGDRPVFPEFVSVGATEPAVDFLTQSIDALLSDAYYRNLTMAQLTHLAQEHAVTGASHRAATWICNALVSGESSPCRVNRAA